MDRIAKALKKLSKKERKLIKALIVRIVARDLRGANLKKLKGTRNIFRVRKGALRIMYKIGIGDKIFILSIERRSKRTYRRFL